MKNLTSETILEKIDRHISQAFTLSKAYSIINAIAAVAYALVYIGDSISGRKQ